MKTNVDILTELIMHEVNLVISQSRTMDETTFAGSRIDFMDFDSFSDEDDDDDDDDINACDNTKCVTVSLCSLFQNDRTEHNRHGSNREDNDSCDNWSDCSSVTMDTVLYDFEQSSLLSTQAEDEMKIIEDCCNVANLHFRKDNFRRSEIVRSTSSNAPRLPKRRKSMDESLFHMILQHNTFQSPCLSASKQTLNLSITELMTTILPVPRAA